MRIWKIVFLILGVLFTFVSTVGTVKIKFVKGHVAYNVGLIIGSLLFLLPGLLFLYLAYRQHKRIKEKEMKKTFDSFLSKNDPA